jgi:hypothetical protein
MLRGPDPSWIGAFSFSMKVANFRETRPRTPRDVTGGTLRWSLSGNSVKVY